MKVDQNKSNDVSLVTGQDEKLFVKAEFVKGTVRNLTTLDIIGLVVLTMFQQGLFQGRLIDDVNHREKVDKD